MASKAYLLKMKAEIEALSPADRLRLAAELLEMRKARMAHTVAERVVLELGAALALDALDKRKKSPDAR